MTITGCSFHCDQIFQIAYVHSTTETITEITHQILIWFIVYIFLFLYLKKNWMNYLFLAPKFGGFSYRSIQWRVGSVKYRIPCTVEVEQNSSIIPSGFCWIIDYFCKFSKLILKFLFTNNKFLLIWAILSIKWKLLELSLSFSFRVHHYPTFHSFRLK